MFNLTGITSRRNRLQLILASDFCHYNRAVVGYCNCVLKMSGKLAVCRNHGPSVLKLFYLIGSLIDHRFNCQCHSG